MRSKRSYNPLAEAIHKTSRISSLRKEGFQVPDEDRSEEISTDERRHYDRSRVIVDVHFDGGDATGDDDERRQHDLDSAQQWQ